MVRGETRGESIQALHVTLRESCILPRVNGKPNPTNTLYECQTLRIHDFYVWRLREQRGCGRWCVTIYRRVPYYILKQYPLLLAVSMAGASG